MELGPSRVEGPQAEHRRQRGHAMKGDLVDTKENSYQKSERREPQKPDTTKQPKHGMRACLLARVEDAFRLENYARFIHRGPPNFH
jgi:hypothetical protein